MGALRMTTLEKLSPTLNPGSLCQNGDHAFILKSSFSCGSTVQSSTESVQIQCCLLSATRKH